MGEREAMGHMENIILAFYTNHTGKLRGVQPTKQSRYINHLLQVIRYNFGIASDALAISRAVKQGIITKIKLNS